MKYTPWFLWVIGSLLWFPVCAQVRVNMHPSDIDLVKRVLLGEGIRLQRVSYVGALESCGEFTSAHSTVPFKTGVVMSTGDIRYAPGPSRGEGFSGRMGTPGDKDLTKLAKGYNYNAAVLEFEFVPKDAYVSFRYIFGSEEYPEYVNSGFNDVFAFFLTDLSTGTTTNLAVIPNTQEPITINNINANRYSDFFQDNSRFRKSDSIFYTLEFDGFTTPLLAYSKVVPGRIYRIKLCIADVGDEQLDSGVFLEGGSFRSQKKEAFEAEFRGYFYDFERQRLLQENGVSSSEPEPSVEVSEPVADTTPAPKSPALSVSYTHMVYFPFDQHQPTPEQVSAFHVFLDTLPKLDSTTCFIQGHTDSVGSVAYNLQLSEKRAAWAENALEKHFGHLTSEALHVQARGEKEPVSDNETSTGRARNRRVEIRLTGYLSTAE